MIDTGMATTPEPAPAAALLAATTIASMDAAICVTQNCMWSSGLGGEDLHRAAREHVEAEGHTVRVEERRSRYTTYRMETP